MKGIASLEAAGTTCTAEASAADTGEIPMQAARFALVIYSKPGVEVLELAEGTPLVLGRGFPAEIQVDDPEVSRQHVRILLRAGQVELEDLGSRNGTRLQGQCIRKKAWLPGMQLEIGSTRLELVKSVRPTQDVQSMRGHVLEDPAMVELYELAARCARVDVPVLVLGETGTGKEHLAHTLHRLSARAERPLRAINCGAIPATLTERTLFGHERGAFTGADRRAPGVFQEAHGGVVFLDEVGELSAGAQTSLLRVLETGQVRRVGSSVEERVDVRVVAATHCDLAAMVERGTFRRDLYYRLNTLTLEVPPLRRRLGDLPALVESFIDAARQQWGVDVAGVDPAVLQRLGDYEWPGNIRQLRNVIERACLTAEGGVLREVKLPDPKPQEVSGRRPHAGALDQGALKERIKSYEAEIIAGALERSGGNRKSAAQSLGLPLRTFFRKLKEHELGGEG